MASGEPIVRDPLKLVEELRAGYAKGITASTDYRKHQLRALLALLNDHEPVLVEALRSDLGKPDLEAISSEIGFARRSIKHALDEIAEWVAPRRQRVPWLLKPAHATVRPEPLGLVLIIGAWNYPINLLFEPAIGAIAAGNSLVLKPSELAPACADALAEWIPRYLDPATVGVYTGGPEQTQRLLERRFDHILFTGSARVGQLVLKAAAEHMTPVTLELGGKCPAIVSDNANLDASANRIAWGKFLNAGQTCIAPDHVLVHAAVEEAFTEKLKAATRRMYGEKPDQSADYGRIINRGHFDRLVNMLDGAKVSHGGRYESADLFIEPTIISNVADDHALMAQEIFGPLLPVRAVESFDDALEHVRSRPKPLAAYLFSSAADEQERFYQRVSAGTCSVNDAVVFTMVPDLPFGGVGASGTGVYRGRHGFDTFSHLKACLTRSTRFETSKRYPPYDGISQRIIRKFF